MSMNEYPAIATALQQFLLEHYCATTDPVDSLHLTTQEIMEKMETILPEFPMTQTDLADWLHLNGFTFYDKGDLRLVWLLKPL